MCFSACIAEYYPAPLKHPRLAFAGGAHRRGEERRFFHLWADGQGLKTGAADHGFKRPKRPKQSRLLQPLLMGRRECGQGTLGCSVGVSDVSECWNFWTAIIRLNQSVADDGRMKSVRDSNGQNIAKLTFPISISFQKPFLLPRQFFVWNMYPRLFHLESVCKSTEVDNREGF